MDRKLIVGLLKDWGLAFGITLAVLVVWRLLAPAPVQQGVAPELRLDDLTGQSFDLSDMAADAYVVNFWATWCAPCRAEIPEFSAFADAHPEVSVLGVSVDRMPPGQLAAAAERLGIRYTVLMDRANKAADAWGVDSFPTTFVLDRDRHIVEVRVGRTNRKGLEAMLDAARAHGDGHADAYIPVQAK